MAIVVAGFLAFSARPYPVRIGPPWRQRTCESGVLMRRPDAKTKSTS
jgi:hypothetical protein